MGSSGSRVNRALADIGVSNPGDAWHREKNRFFFYYGTTTFNTTTISIMTFSITTLSKNGRLF